MGVRGLSRAAGVLLGMLLSSGAGARTSSAILGTVRDDGTQAPLQDIAVTATSPSLQGELTVVTEAGGNYRIPGVPPRVYTLRFERERFRPYVRADLLVREGCSLRVNLRPASSSELVAGAEYEPRASTTVSAACLHRRLDTALASLPTERRGDGVLLVNPGSGLGSGLPRAERSYGAVMLAGRQDFADNWLSLLSYTGSRLRGNQAAPWSSVDGPVASGVLPPDRPHTLKAYGARRFHPNPTVWLTPGLAYLGSSGAHGEGQDSRMPWVHTVDVHLNAAWRLRRDELVRFDLDVFNVQTDTRVAEAPAPEGTFPVGSQYPPPRQVRFGARYEL